MAVPIPARRRRRQRRHEVHKPTGALHPRVEKVGPEHFGIVSVDYATRVKHLRGTLAGGKNTLNGKAYTLVAGATVLPDAATDPDTLKGAAGTDWFFGLAPEAVDRVVVTEFLN